MDGLAATRGQAKGDELSGSAVEITSAGDNTVACATQRTGTTDWSKSAGKV